LLKELIVGGTSPWETLYDPARKPPGGILNFVKENVTAIQNMTEHVVPAELTSADALEPGDGGVLTEGKDKIAVCRDKNGNLHRSSAVCTHLGCIVQWNTTEQCWDCPCHGSQFAPGGAVLNAPAISPLAPAEKKAKADA
jgi:Rieske Fe-S protein